MKTATLVPDQHFEKAKFHPAYPEHHSWTNQQFLDAIRAYFLAWQEKIGFDSLIDQLTDNDPEFVDSRGPFLEYVYQQVCDPKSKRGEEFFIARSRQQMHDFFLECYAEFLGAHSRPFKSDSVIQQSSFEAQSSISSALIEEKNTSNFQGQSWKVKGFDLLEASKQMSDLGIERIAELCGYFEINQQGQKRPMVDAYLAELHLNDDCKDQSKESSRYFLLNDRLAVTCGPLYGTIYVRKDRILADQEFYNLNDFKTCDDDCSPMSFDIPVMIYESEMLVYVDNDEAVDDEDQLLAFGIRLEDVIAEDWTE